MYAYVYIYILLRTHEHNENIRTFCANVNSLVKGPIPFQTYSLRFYFLTSVENEDRGSGIIVSSFSQHPISITNNNNPIRLNTLNVLQLDL